MQIRIKGYTFHLASPYAEGSVLTALEAEALNNLRAENIQNNFRPQVNAQVAKLGDGDLLSQPVLDALQTQLAGYDQLYKFNEKSTRSRIGDIEAEARTIARERLAAQLARDGTEVEPEQFEQLVTIQSALPSVVEEARSRVAARRSALAGGMDSL